MDIAMYLYVLNRCVWRRIFFRYSIYLVLLYFYLRQSWSRLPWPSDSTWLNWLPAIHLRRLPFNHRFQHQFQVDLPSYFFLIKVSGQSLPQQEAPEAVPEIQKRLAALESNRRLMTVNAQTQHDRTPGLILVDPSSSTLVFSVQQFEPTVHWN